ncbi:MAG: alpha/beta fold hydrolase [Actinobacteria bacterium]|nr:alpha/beta fold hydrolase [Actinomycetota bacterium]MCB8998338.1 alpha/beta fold hydrolase [Actinomycetota bacterium]MCB9415463.1 alpha/beta fold hydrolase [Actinomycetota bacterium]HRY10499.1 alpha/beta fold hydrolase [Candidatus Nanopelagicales bacterium]
MDAYLPGRALRNPHLQTTRSRLLPPRVRLPEPEVVLVDMPDGSGDRLALLLHEGDPDKPLVLVIHGLGGSAESDYVRYLAAGLIGAGFPVGRLDLRGAGTGEHAVGMYHGGKTEDVRAVIDSLDRPVAVVGFSLGGNLTIKLLGEHTDHVVAGVAVSAPLDLAVSVEHLHHMAGGLYEKFLVHRLRKEALRRGARYTPEERAGIVAAKGLVEFDNAVTAPRHGWRDAAEYYAVNSSIDYLDKVELPLLLIHSKDDPMVPFGPYLSVDWEALPTTELVLTDHGGHVGFHSRGRPPYYVGLSVEFLDRVSGTPDPA